MKLSILDKYIFSLTLFFVSSIALAADDHPVAMYKQKISANAEKQLRDAVCSIAEFDCSQRTDSSSIALYKVELIDGAAYYVISESKLQLARVNPISDGSFRVEHMWDASTYTHSVAPPGNEDDLKDGGIFIFPGLYAIGPERYAVAVARNSYTSYSRGGAYYEQADFLFLDNTKTRFDDTSRVFTGVPFSCNNQPTPGCANGSCEKWITGQSEGHLTLRFVPARVHNQYDWLATWHASDTPDGKVGTVRTTKSKQTVRLVVSSRDNERQLNALRTNFCR
jgi:hypothetical protein